MTTTMTSTSTGTGNMLTDARNYWRVSGIALAAVAVLGIVLNAVDQATLLGADFLAFDWTHNIVHVVLAGIALTMGFTTVAQASSKMIALVIGVVYGLLGVVGFFMADIGPIHLELGENIVHLVLGAWGIVAGVAK